jgi:hypothetical protein
MQPKNLHVITKLVKACELLKAVEVRGETKKCAGTIRNARLEIENAVKEMQKKKAVNWRKVAEILGVITKVYALLKLLGLGEFLNFCKKFKVMYAVT